jgi:hypothetical protein
VYMNLTALGTHICDSSFSDGPLWLASFTEHTPYCGRCQNVFLF